MWLKFINSWFLNYFIELRSDDVKFYASISVLIVAAAMVAKSLRCYFVFSSCLRLSRSLALSMISSLVHSSLHLFFDRISLGRLLNRFLTDSENVEKPLSFIGDRLLYLG